MSLRMRRLLAKWHCLLPKCLIPPMSISFEGNATQSRHFNLPGLRHLTDLGIREVRKEVKRPFTKIHRSLPL